MSLVNIRKPQLPYVLLTPVDSSPNLDIVITHYSDVPTWTEWFSSVRESDVIALDIETKGTNPADPESDIVGIGFSHGRSSIYIDVHDIGGTRLQGLVDTIEQLPAVIGHNIYFDGGMLRAKWDCYPKWVACTYGMYRQLATEGFPGQRWGLKGAQEDLLGWTETNEKDLDIWLVSNGHIKNIKKYAEGESPEKYYAPGYYPIDTERGEPRLASPDKGEMWRAPRNILGHYCALDCDSTWQLYTQVLLPVAEKFPELLRYHSEEYLTLVDIHIDQKIHGIRVSLEGLSAHAEDLKSRISATEEKFRTHSLVSGFVEEREKELVASYLEKEPAKYKKTKPIPEEPPRYVPLKDPGEEPPRLTKSGKLNKNWEKWDEKRRAYDAAGGVRDNLNWIKWKERVDSGHYSPEVSKNWENWRDKMSRIEAGEVPEFRFNVASGDQLRWLLYDCIFDYEIIRPHVDEKNRGVVLLHREHVTGMPPVELDMTESGLLPVDGKAVQQMGEVGEILSHYADLTKELSYVESYRELAIPDPRDSRYGTLHASFRMPGTLTGRLSSSGPNMQQVPKSRGTLDCFVPRPGHVFIQCDHTALENVVLAELSGDEALMQLYGPGAEPHDSYLFNAARMYEIAGVEVFREIAARYVPVPDVISQLKKEFKVIRGISKKTTLSKNYGIGAEKLYKDLLLQGAAVTREDVQAIHAAFDQVYAGVADWQKELEEEWRVNRGWVLNGIGRPVGVSDRKKKDLVNQVCQSTGHDIHMRYVYHLDRLLGESEIPWNPIVIDFHDESIIEVPTAYTDIVLDIMERQVYNIVNSELQGIIPLSGGGEIARNFSDFKLE